MDVFWNYMIYFAGPLAICYIKILSLVPRKYVNMKAIKTKKTRNKADGFLCIIHMPVNDFLFGFKNLTWANRKCPMQADFENYKTIADRNKFLLKLMLTQNSYQVRKEASKDYHLHQLYLGTFSATLKIRRHTILC